MQQPQHPQAHDRVIISTFDSTSGEFIFSAASTGVLSTDTYKRYSSHPEIVYDALSFSETTSRQSEIAYNAASTALKTATLTVSKTTSRPSEFEYYAASISPRGGCWHGPSLRLSAPTWSLCTMQRVLPKRRSHIVLLQDCQQTTRDRVQCSKYQPKGQLLTIVLLSDYQQQHGDRVRCSSARSAC